jgi:hypothetical protein
MVNNMNATLKNRIETLLSIGTQQTKKGDWILNKRTSIPFNAGITLRTQYCKEYHKESFLGKTYHYIIQWDTVTCEVRRNGEAMTSSDKYIQGYFAFDNESERDELFEYLVV